MVRKVLQFQHAQEANNPRFVLTKLFLLGGLSVGKAAKRFGVPKSTLKDRKNKRYRSTEVGRKSELTDEEEKALKFYIDYMASVNHPLSIPAVKAFAWAISKRHGKKSRFNPTTGPGNKWYLLFKKRHSLTNRKPDNVDRGRSRMANITVFNQHFDLLEKTVKELGLENKPASIFNCDESMVAMDRRTGKVVVSKRTKQAYSESKGTRDHITVNACVAANGSILPPHIIFQKAFPSGPYARNGPDGALYSVSESGYMDTELFLAFLSKLFTPNKINRGT